MPLNDDLCDACGYHLILRKVLDMEGVRKPDTSTGLERLLKGQLSEGATPENVLFWAKLVAGFFLLFFSILFFGRYGLTIAVIGIAAYVVVSRAVAARRKESDSAVNQDALSAVVWSAVLFVERAVAWRLPTWPFPKARALAIHDPAFDDEELGDLEQLDDLEALDFEGTSITDEGLTYLAELKQLRFLVLRRTKVTPAGVGRLQWALQKAWIWY